MRFDCAFMCFVTWSSLVQICNCYIFGSGMYRRYTERDTEKELTLLSAISGVTFSKLLQLILLLFFRVLEACSAAWLTVDICKFHFA